MIGTQGPRGQRQIEVATRKMVNCGLLFLALTILPMPLLSEESGFLPDGVQSSPLIEALNSRSHCWEEVIQLLNLDLSQDDAIYLRNQLRGFETVKKTSPHFAIATGLRKRVVVLEVENETRISNDVLGGLADVTDKLEEGLVYTENIIVLDRGQLAGKLAPSFNSRREHLSKRSLIDLEMAQIIIRAIVTRAEATREGGLNFGRLQLGAAGEANVKMRVYIYDTVTGQALDWISVGSSSRIGRAFVSKERSAKVDRKRARALRLALVASLAQAVEWVASATDRVLWQGVVAHVSGRRIIVNAGRQEKMMSGMILNVFEQGAEIVDPVTGEILGRFDEEIGMVRIQTVESHYSIASLLEGTGVVKGNIVRPSFSAY